MTDTTISVQDALARETVLPLFAKPPRPSYCSAVGISERHARRQFAKGLIPTLKVGRARMVPTEFIRAVLSGEIEL